MFEPKRQSDINLLWLPFREKVALLLEAMRRRGYDPVIFESLRTEKRQAWLYGYGRTHHKGRKPVTFTLKSRHLPGKAADIISKSKLWNHPAFFDALKDEAKRLGLETLDFEGCHVQWGG
jgi:hypothetical protein